MASSTNRTVCRSSKTDCTVGVAFGAYIWATLVVEISTNDVACTYCQKIDRSICPIGAVVALCIRSAVASQTCLITKDDHQY
jgi:hypothetical protein